MKCLFAFVIPLSLTACGGGGGGGNGGTATENASGVSNGIEKQPIVNSRSVATFAGNYTSPCIALSNGTNYETGEPLYVKPFFSVTGSGNSTGGSAFRFDFYDDSECAKEPLGSLRNDNPNNLFTLLGDIQSGSRLATRVRLDFEPTSAVFSSSISNDTVLYGGNLRLKLPRYLFGGFYGRDLWSLDGNALYEGSPSTDSDGYPLALEAISVTTKIPVLPPMPATACPATTLSWTANGAMCFAEAKPTASGRSNLLPNIGTGHLGMAKFSCNDGAWQEATGSSCAIKPIEPTLQTCPSQTFNWSQGAETCSGTAPMTVRGNDVNVLNTLSGKQGAGYWSCKADGTWQLWNVNVPASCWAPPPPTTDPKKLAEEKNCLGCHAISGKGYSIPGTVPLPSFEAIADYYRANPTALETIANLVKSGSAGVLGSRAMPANPQASDADLAIILPWVLAQPQ